MPYIHNFKEQILLTANCFNKINFQTISSITIDFYIVSFLISKEIFSIAGPGAPGYCLVTFFKLNIILFSIEPPLLIN